MRRKQTRTTVLGLALLVALPLYGIADAPVPVPLPSEASCCSLASAYTSSIFPGGDGDEGFFGMPIGAPSNAMILLDNSSSMLDFPVRLPAPAAGTGNCADPELSAVVPTATPYDDGTTNTFVTDSPPWSTANCGSNTDACLFKPAAYYKYVQDLPGYTNGFTNKEWDGAGATRYTAAAICTGVVNPAGCTQCLTDEGYYLFRPAGDVRTHARFTGAFLNAHPPKFVIARKAVKDLVALDIAAPTDTASVRFGLTIFTTGDDSGTSTGMRDNDGGRLVVPLGPNCDSSALGFQPTNNSTSNAYKAARQKLVDAINSPTLVPFTDSPITFTPLAESLFNIGQYFSDTRSHGAAGTGTLGGVAYGPTYDTMFGTSWVLPSTSVPGRSFYETAAGTVGASWVSGAGQRQASVCWACQQNSTIIVTDGEPTNDENLPRSGTTSNHTTGPTPGTLSTNTNNDFRKWSASSLAVTCPTGLSCTGYLLQKVASFLYNSDLRPDLPNDKQTQTMATYTVSFGIEPVDDASKKALALLQTTASLGGGRFYNTTSGAELSAALTNVVSDTVARATSFSVSNTNTLQTGNNNQLFLARFRKLLGTQWEGHLHRFKVFNEFVQGCDAKKTTAAQTLVTCGTKTLNPNLNGDDDCDGKAVCDGLFILDAECDPVAEDENGNFKKATLDPATHKYVATLTDADAVPYWDAGENLSVKTFPATHPDPDKRSQPNAAFRSADETATDKRVIYTVIDQTSDGKFTAADGLVEFEEKNAAAIAPLLELNGSRRVGSSTQTQNTCAALLEKAGFCGEAPLAACPVADASGHVDAASVTQCAKLVIQWVRGWDVLDGDNDGCAGPGNPSNPASCPGAVLDADGNVLTASTQDGEERIRANDSRPDKEFWKLGDVFHSSPVLVKPPATEMICDLALENQCVATLHSPKGYPGTIQTPADYDVDGNGTIGPGEDAYEKYRKDNAARRQIVLVGANDGLLHAFDAGEALGTTPDWLGTFSYSPGTGAEVWAFVPPDLLPKLKVAMEEHEYFVDGNVMVRDTWSDAGTKDGRKQPAEFHTLAVLSERAGGSQYTALDVTDPDHPVFRWTFPENCTVDQNVMAQSWSGFAPRPPPIGPVKLALPAGSTQDPMGRGFEERWIVMLNGGYDPTLTRGRGVWMVDAWDGKVVWRFTDDMLKTKMGNNANMWPVPAAVGLLDVGNADQAILDSDGFFDTATWGDMGGTLFVARFNAPGTLGAGGTPVTDWFAARAFEEARDDGKQEFQNRSEFFQMTANAVDLDRGYVHTYLGSGNREHLLQVGAACGPGNILACCQGGCNADMTTKFDYGGCSVESKVHCTAGRMVQDRTAYSGSCSDSTESTRSYTCGGMDARIQLHLSCGNAGNPPDILARLTCDSDGNCSVRQDVKEGKPVDVTKLTAPTWHNRFYGIWSYGGNGRMFSTDPQATTFDGNRFTDIAFAGTCGVGGCRLIDTTYATTGPAGAVTCPTGVTKCSANGGDPGWFYEYGRKCPSGTCDDALPWLDEKTASGATVLAGCVDWNTFRPRGTSTSATDPCVSADTGVARNYTYLADFVSGAPSASCGFAYASAACGATTEYARARPRATIAPPPDPTQLVAIGMDGEVKYLAAQIEPGGTPTTALMGQSRELMQSAYWLEVNPELHVCRHVDQTTCR